MYPSKQYCHNHPIRVHPSEQYCGENHSTRFVSKVQHRDNDPTRVPPRYSVVTTPPDSPSRYSQSSRGRSTSPPDSPSRYSHSSRGKSTTPPGSPSRYSQSSRGRSTTPPGSPSGYSQSSRGRSTTPSGSPSRNSRHSRGKSRKKRSKSQKRQSIERIAMRSQFVCCTCPEYHAIKRISAKALALHYEQKHNNLFNLGHRCTCGNFFKDDKALRKHKRNCFISTFPTIRQFRDYRIEIVRAENKLKKSGDGENDVESSGSGSALQTSSDSGSRDGGDYEEEDDDEGDESRDDDEDDED
ncbi:hypothetical protein ABFX02_11G081700 [Erythranthe guttata]